MPGEAEQFDFDAIDFDPELEAVKDSYVKNIGSIVLFGTGLVSQTILRLALYPDAVKSPSRLTMATGVGFITSVIMFTISASKMEDIKCEITPPNQDEQ